MDLCKRVAEPADYPLSRLLIVNLGFLIYISLNTSNLNLGKFYWKWQIEGLVQAMSSCPIEENKAEACMPELQDMLGVKSQW